MSLNKPNYNMLGKDIHDLIDGHTAQLAEKAQQSDLDVTNSNVGLKADKTYVDTQIQSLASGSPKGVYATFSALQTAFPSGNSNIYVVTADGNWYYWNGTAWTPGGQYQSTGIPNGSIKIEKLDSDLKSNLIEFDEIPFSIINAGNYNIGTNAYTTASGFRYITFNCFEGEEYLVNATINGVNMALIVFFDVNNNFLSYLEQGISGSDTVFSNYSFIVPKNATSFSFNFKRGSESSIKKRMLNVETRFKNIEETISAYAEVTNKTTIPSVYFGIGSPNTPTTNTNLNVETVNCNPGEKYKVSGTMISNNIDSFATVMFYDSSNNFKGYLLKCTSTDSTQTFTDVEFTIPDSVAYFYLQHTKADSFSIQKFNYSDVNQLSEKVSSLSDDVESLSNEIEGLNTSDTKNNIIDCWGDSLTNGTGGNGTTWPLVLQSLIGDKYVVNNMGTGGETANTIAGRQGGLPMLLTPTFTIPEDNQTPVQVTFTTPYYDTVAPLRQANNNYWGINPCYINGIEGTLSITQTSSTSDDNEYFFTRNTPGDAVVVDRPTPLITDNMLNKRSDIMVIWMGQNGGPTDLVGKINAMVDYNTRKTKDYIIIGLHTDTAQNRAALEKQMYFTYGRRYINLRDYMVNYGLADAGITPTQADLDAIALGETPPSLLYDGTHFLGVGYTIIGKLVYSRLKELGIIDVD